MEQPQKLTADLLRPQCRGRWLELFQVLCPGFFDEAIANIGTHVTCPFHGGEEDFRFTKKATKKGGNTEECGVAMCTCGAYPDGFAVLHKAMGGRFYSMLKAVDEHLNGRGGAPRQAITPAKPTIKAEDQRPPQEILARVRKLWTSGKSLDLKVTPYYLHRGIDPRVLAKLQEVRALASLGYFVKKDGKIEQDGAYPAILAAMRNVKGDLIAVHRTWLSPDRTDKAPVPKAKKLSETPDATGAAIRLFDATGADTLGLTEGVETACGVKQLAEGRFWPELGDIPIWACYSAGNIKSFQVPPELLATLRKIVVFADNDANDTGFNAAEAFKERMAEEHPDIEVVIKMPDLTGWDWLDVLVNL